MFGEGALRIARALMAEPRLVRHARRRDGRGDLASVAAREDVERAHQHATRNRDRALEQFPPTVQSKKDGVLVYDASSNQIRRERFAAFYHHPDIHYSVGVIPTRSGYHVSAGENPWNPPPAGAHIGAIMESYGGGGHRAVGGANPPTLEDCRRVANEVALKLRQSLLASR